MDLFLTHYPLSESLIYWMDYVDLVNLTRINDRYRIRFGFHPALKEKRLIGLNKLSDWIANQSIWEVVPKSFWGEYTVKQLADLKWLYFTNIRTIIPPEFGLLTNLRWLYLTKLIYQIPKEIGDLKNLRGFYARRNRITKIPSEIGQLINLTELNLSCNQLTEIPPEIGQLTNLKILNLSLNEITEIPQEIGKLTKLKILNLNDNQISELPPQIGQLINLKELYFRWNTFLRLDKNLVFKLEQQGTKVVGTRIFNNSNSNSDKDKNDP